MTGPCQHRKVRVRGKAGKFYAECLGCDIRGPDYRSPTEAYLARRADFLEVTAFKAAEVAKAMEAEHARAR